MRCGCSTTSPRTTAPRGSYPAAIDWAAVKGAGVSFAIARVSDGLNYPDAYFDSNWAAIKAHGMVRGSYQYFEPAQDPIAQANYLLQHIGTLLRATLRASDLPARIGGDEFVALMPDTSVDGAVITSERLLGRLAQHPLQVLDQSLTATVSIGVASAEGCSSLEELLARADAALYRAKKEGKSRVCRAD